MEREVSAHELQAKGNRIATTGVLVSTIGVLFSVVFGVLEIYSPTGTLPPNKVPPGTPDSTKVRRENPPPSQPGVPPVRTGGNEPSKPADAELTSLAKLMNPGRVESNRVAVAIRARGGGAGGSPVDRLVSGIEAKGVSLSRGFFRSAFLSSGYFDQFLAGDGGLLARSGALGSGSIAFVGELAYSFRSGDSGLTVCDLNLSYTVLDSDGSARARRTIPVSVPAYDRTTALNDAVSALLEEHAPTIVSDLRS